MSSESESESEGSDYSYASSTQEKLTKQESALVYAHQMTTMVESFGHFLTQMKELSGGGGSGSRKRREAHASTRVGGGVQSHVMVGGGVQSHVMVENGGQENVSSSSSHVVPPRGSKNGLPNNGYAAGNNIQEPPATSTSSGFSVPDANAVINRSCCCNDTLNKKVDVMFGFVQTLFANHLQLLGKCYQDQMETHRRLDEMRSMTEDYDEELEYLEQQFLALKKSSDDVKFSISKLSESKTVTKDCVTAIDRISDQIQQLRKYILAPTSTSTSCARAPAQPPAHEKKGEKSETAHQTTVSYAKVKAGLNLKPTSTSTTTTTSSKSSNAAEGVAETNGMNGAGDANVDLELN